MKRVIPPIVGCSGKTFHVSGHSINTDIITPARFLKCLSFDDLGPHAFEDARKQARLAEQVHPFDVPENQGASILLVDGDFGSGSSREHSPQALKFWGIRAIIGLSFANIFRNNCLTNGIICVDVLPQDQQFIAEQLKIGRNNLSIDLQQMNIVIETESNPYVGSCTMPTTDRDMFLGGRWDSIVELIDGKPAVDVLLAGLPYVQLAA